MSLLPIIILTAVVLIVMCSLLFLTSLVGPKRPQNAAKMMPYECGIRGIERKDTKISVRFYLTAILFILFDIEVVFMYPWSLVFKDFLATSGSFIFIEMMVFMAVLLFGLFYIWRARALEWE